MECPDCGEKMSRDNTRVYAWHCPKCNDDYKDDYVMGYWKGFADAKFAAQQSVESDVVSPAEEKEYLAEMNKVASELLG